MLYPPNDPTRKKRSIIGFLVVGALTLGMGLASQGFAPTSAAAVRFYAALIVFLGLSLAGEWWLPACNRRWAVWLYFLLQLGLAFAMAEARVPLEATWLLTMPVMSQAAASLPWPAVVALALALLANYCVLPGDFMWSWHDRLRTALSLLAAYVFVAGMTLAAECARQARSRAEQLARELEEANARLRDSAAQTAELAAANERNRIARDIHDGLGHYLTVISVQLQAARTLLPGQSERAIEAIGTAEQTSRRALEDVRRSVGTLRAPAARPLLAEAIAGVVRESGLPASLHIEGIARLLSDAAEQALYRSAQEGLTNVRKHAAGAQAMVLLDYRDPRRVSLEVADDGPGAAGEIAGGFGLTGLRERLAAVGGTLVTRVAEPRGFVLRVEVPS